jgi:hypothetical protein
MPDTLPPESLLKKDLKRLVKGGPFKKAWLLGLVLGLLCHLVPPEYHDACKAVMSACTP